MTNVTELPRRDLVAEMTGPENTGHAVIIDGRLVPNLSMRDRGEMVEFALDGRFLYAFPREWAWLAAAFAFQSMATAAGFACPAGEHFTKRPFAPQVAQLGEVPRS